MNQESPHDSVLDRIKPLLTSGENVLALATQNSISSPILGTRDAAIVTNRRFIIFRPKVFGRMDMDDFLWQDIDDVFVKTDLLGCAIHVRGSRRTKTGAAVPFQRTINGLNKTQSLNVYARAQEMEEQWREKNRSRLMEEERARSGGIYLQAPAVAQPGLQQPLSSVEDRLVRLRALLNSGLITDAEYEAKKTRIVAEI